MYRAFFIIFLLQTTNTQLISQHTRPVNQQHQQSFLYALINTHCLHKRLERRTNFIVSLNND